MSTILGPYIPYGLFQTKGEMCAKFGSDSFRNVNLYKVQTNKRKKLTAFFIRSPPPRKLEFVVGYFGLGFVLLTEVTVLDS
jgi:hypothetical protein